MKPARRTAPGALLLLLGLGAHGALGCASGPTPRVARPGEDVAQVAYDNALLLYQAEAWPEATEAFRAVKAEHSGSRWAWLAELRLADVEFRQEHYTEALSQFRSWIRYHPTQREAAYAHFMIARCYVAQMPDDWLLVPPSFERDMSSVHDAESALARFVRDYPRADERPEAERLLRQVRQLLARHELYVAEFYLSRNRLPAAVGRLRGAIQTFQDPDIRARALLQLGEVYLRGQQQAEARGVFAALVNDYASRAEAAAARAHLARLGEGPTISLDTSDDTIPPPSAGTGAGSGSASERARSGGRGRK